MKMEVQIFLVEDNKALIYDNDQLDEFKSLVSELGLQCQNVIDKEKSPIPYMWIDEATIRAFKLLCPVSDRVEAYQFEIPLEVIRHLSLCKRERYFDWIEVWSTRKNPDPFMIGRVYKDSESREKGYSWAADHYLIGRWGDQAKEIHELINMAVRVAEERIKNYAEANIAKLESWRKCPQVWAKKFINSGDNETSQALNASSENFLPF